VRAPNLDFDGYSIHAGVVPPALCEPLAAVFAAATVGRAGCRGGLQFAAVRELAASANVRALVEPVLGGDAFVFRATLFDKTPAANWLVAWHQDRVVPVRERRAAAGFTRWSRKDGGWYVEPPAAVSRQLLAVRVDLDGSTPENGALRVLPGTHHAGVLTPERLRVAVSAMAPATCNVPAGGALCLRPLLVHASSRARAPSHRRVVHLEFAGASLPGGLCFANCAD
jgi:ectoine hydroxylase-related dioxygenase (phytanoyl-CoA dioxygenase family)